jgi:hypothetical protein
MLDQDRKVGGLYLSYDEVRVLGIDVYRELDRVYYVWQPGDVRALRLGVGDWVERLVRWEEQLDAISQARIRSILRDDITARSSEIDL